MQKRGGNMAIQTSWIAKYTGFYITKSVNFVLKGQYQKKKLSSKHVWRRKLYTLLEKLKHWIFVDEMKWKSYIIVIWVLYRTLGRLKLFCAVSAFKRSMPSNGKLIRKKLQQFAQHTHLKYTLPKLECHVRHKNNPVLQSEPIDRWSRKSRNGFQLAAFGISVNNNNKPTYTVYRSCMCVLDNDFF